MTGQQFRLLHVGEATMLPQLRAGYTQLPTPNLFLGFSTKVRDLNRYMLANAQNTVLDTLTAIRGNTGQPAARSQPIASTSKIPLEDSHTSQIAPSTSNKRTLRYVKRLERGISAAIAASDSTSEPGHHHLSEIVRRTDDLCTCLGKADSKALSGHVRDRLVSVATAFSDLFNRLEGTSCAIQLKSAFALLSQRIDVKRFGAGPACPTHVVANADLVEAADRLAAEGGSEAERVFLQALRKQAFASCLRCVSMQGLDQISATAEDNRDFMQELGKAFLSIKAKASSRSVRCTSLTELQEALLHIPYDQESGAKLRIYGPRNNVRNWHAGVAYLLYCWSHPKGQTQTGPDQPDTTRLQLRHVRALLGLLEKERLPPNRQIITAILIVCKVVGRKEAEALRGHFPLLWQEWTLLRENDVQREPDEVLLEGFLHSISRRSNEAWQRQALAMVLDLTDVQPAGIDAPAERFDFSNPLSSTKSSDRLIKAAALAALRVGQVDTFLRCLGDGRLAPEDTLLLLWSLAAHVRFLPSSLLHLACPLVRVIASVSAQVAPALAKHTDRAGTPPKKMADASIYVSSLLLRFQFAKSARALLDSTSDPQALSEMQLQRLFEFLVIHGHHNLALEWWRRLSHDQRCDLGTAKILLASPVPRLSDTVWQDTTADKIARKRQVAPILLQARLQHHIDSGGLRYKQAMFELHHSHSGHFEGLKTPLLVAVMRLHAAARRFGSARRLYKQILARQDAPPGLLNLVLPFTSKPLSRGWRPLGPASATSRMMAELDRMIQEDGHMPDFTTAKLLLLESLKWGSLTKEEIWAAFESGLQGSQQRDWHGELRPLYRMVVKAFRSRGDTGEARKVVVMMAKERNRRRDEQLAKSTNPL